MKQIWMYWDRRKPQLIQQIENHNRKNLTTWKIHYLDDITITNYIPSFPPKFDTLIPQHKADWIRLYLISTYGGLWCDASIIINSEKAMDELWEKTKTHDFVGFYNGKKVNGIYENIENWCFASKKGGILVTKWLTEYNKAIREGFKQYNDRILKNTHLKVYIKGNNKLTTYFTAYHCLQHVMRHEQLPPMYVMDANDSMFKLAKNCPKKQLNICTMNKLKTRKIKLPYIKLTRHERNTHINIDSYFKSH